MNLLSQRTLQSLRRTIRRHSNTQPYLVDPTGGSLRLREPLPDVDQLRRNRLYAIHESVKLGESVCFELCRGLHAWLVAIENKRIVHGGLIEESGSALEESGSRGIRVSPRNQGQPLRMEFMFRHWTSFGFARS